MQGTSHGGRNLLIVIGILILIGAGGYYYAGRDVQSQDDLLFSAPITAGAGGGAVEGDILPALLALKKLRLDDAVFHDPAFQSLVDFGQTLSPVPQGRTNPFAPIDGSGLTASTTR
jgi:hypothetical protein